MITVIKSDSSITVREQDGQPTLQQLYLWMNCDMVEIVYCGSGNEAQMIVDENGKIVGKERNLLASALYNNKNDTIVGTVVVLTQEHRLT